MQECLSIDSQQEPVNLATFLLEKEATFNHSMLHTLLKSEFISIK